MPFAPVNVVLFTSDVQFFRFYSASYMLALNVSVRVPLSSSLSTPAVINVTHSLLIILIRRQAPPTRKPKPETPNLNTLLHALRRSAPQSPANNNHHHHDINLLFPAQTHAVMLMTMARRALSPWWCTSLCP